MSDLFCPVTVLVMRHANAVYDGTTVPGVGDGGRISDRGRAQVTDVVARLADRRVSAVYSSPLTRAWDTAELVAQELDVPLKALPGVREFDVGNDATDDAGSDGLVGSTDRVVAGSQAGPSQDAPAHDAVHRTVDEVFGRWLDGDDAAALPGGESGSQVVARFTETLEGVADLHRGETVLVISHGGVMTLALPRMTGRSAKALSSIGHLAETAVVEVEGDADGWRLLSWPDLT